MSQRECANGADINWQLLTQEASAAMGKAYAPYSKFPVGVAALVNDGRIISGSNVENASYGLTLCAECSLVSSLIATGGGKLVAAVCVDQNSNLLQPCGRCRQLLYEHADSNFLIATPKGPVSINELLPWAFGPADLNK